MMANGVTIGPILAGHGLIDDRKLGATHGLGMVPEAALGEWNLQQREILRADEIHAHFRFLRGRTAHNFNVLAPAARRRGGVGGNAGDDDLRHGSDFGAELLEIFGAVFPGHVRVFVHRNGDGHGIVGVVAEIRVDKPEKAFARGTSRGEQEKCQGNLSAHHRGVATPRSDASGHAARASLHEPCDLRP